MASSFRRLINFTPWVFRPITLKEAISTSGVRGITLGSEDDEVIGMICVEPEKANVLVVSENGYGKRSDIEDYRTTNRGGKGVKTINLTEKTGSLIALLDVTDDEHLMIITRSGLTIRLEIASLRVIQYSCYLYNPRLLKSKD